MNRQYGWKRSDADVVPLSLAQPMQRARLPEAFSLVDTHRMPGAYNQLQTSSCVGNGVARAVHFDVCNAELDMVKLAELLLAVPARLKIYGDAREIEGTFAEDQGCFIPDALVGVGRGFALETGPDSWPFDPTKVLVKPPPSVYAAAQKRLHYSGRRIRQNEDAIKQMIYAGKVVVFGAELFEAFESAELEATGVVRMPSSRETPVGGHCMTIIGWDNKRRCALVMNSWGGRWGISGACWFPWAYLLNPGLASDFSVVDRA